MSDKLTERMNADKGWVARQMSKVPGFRGYVENTTFWEADKMLREELARRLSEIKAPVGKAIEAAGEDVRAGKVLSALDGLLNGLDRTANTVRFADYGHSALDSKIKLGGDDLARLLAHDRGAFELLEAVEQAGAALAEAGADKLQAALDAFENRFAQRKQVLVEAAGTTAGGEEG